MVARSSVEVEVRRIEQPARLVDLPRVDLTKNLAQQNNHHSNIIPDNRNEPDLVLPAHPGSTTSSEAGRPNHMLIRSTPKAEQFEVRNYFLFTFNNQLFVYNFFFNHTGSFKNNHSFCVIRRSN